MKSTIPFRRRVIRLVLCLMLLSLLTGAVFADMGPKPSVQVTFTGTDTPFYATLLSKEITTGPHWAWNYGEEAPQSPDELDYPEREFARYADADGFYFLRSNHVWDFTQGLGTLEWHYFPPNTFKILLYFPDSGTYCISPVYETYAFDSYFTADLSSWQSGTMTAHRSYDYRGELVSLAARIVLTILIELGIALLFGYWEKSLMKLLFWANVVTQVLLNVAASYVSVFHGGFSLAMLYLFLEFPVFLAEGLFYCMTFNRFAKRHRSGFSIFGYSFVANAVSFGVGLFLSEIVPGLF